MQHRRARAISTAIRRAVLVAMAPACSSQQTVQMTDSGGGDDDSIVATDAGVDADDADADDATISIDDSSFIDVPTIPLPDGCVVSGKPDVFAPCGYSEEINDPNACEVSIDADIQPPNVCEILCDPTETDCVYYEFTEGGIISCGAGCVGRLHEGARRAADVCDRVASGDADGEWLARAAFLEAASIDAFCILSGELRHHGAPRSLTRAAVRAARDEIRHARTMRSLARSRGRDAKRPAAPVKAPPRSLLDIAIENAIEGCVRETFGAALATWQAEHAEDPAIRDAMHAIARDETRHAELGWRIADWLDAKLDRSERAKVIATRKAASRDLERTVDELHPSLQLGLPSKAATASIIDTLRDTLWS